MVFLGECGSTISACVSCVICSVDHSHLLHFPPAFLSRYFDLVSWCKSHHRHALNTFVNDDHTQTLSVNAA